MIVYHGSNSSFRKLRIDKKLVKYNSTLENEGLGIYFSTNSEVASSYGKYIYILEINDSCFYDFRLLNTCNSYLANIRNYVLKETEIDISRYIDMKSIALRMKLGGQAISGVGHEIYLNLDSNDYWYSLSKTKIERVFRLLNKIDKNCPKAYMFTYHIPNIGVIKDVSEDVVRIVEKLKEY